MTDSYGRQINYARISLTDRCNFRCIYCMPECGIAKKSYSEILSYGDMEKVIHSLCLLGINKVRFTGGEPLVRKNSADFICSMASKNKDIGFYITTNSSLLFENAEKLKNSGVKGVNISLDSLDEKAFSRITRGGSLNDTMKGLYKAIDCGMQVKLNSVILKGINDKYAEKYASFGASLDVIPRFIELMPFIYSKDIFEKYYVSAKTVISHYPCLTKANEAKTHGQNCEYYCFPNGDKIGFISSVSEKFCKYCNRIRITADGKLILCLHQSKEYDLKPYLGNTSLLKEYMEKCISEKPKEHCMSEGRLQTRQMNSIGG